MREVALVDRKISKSGDLAGSREADRFGLFSPSRGWGVAAWLGAPFVLAWLVGWIAAGPYDRLPAILVGLAMAAFFFWLFWRGVQSERPENNFVELGEDAIRIQAYGRAWLKVTYAEMLGVRPVARVSLLQRWLWMIWRKDLAAYLEIELSRPRWFVHWWLPWWWRRVILRLEEPTQFELVLKARLDSFAGRRAEPASQ